MRSTNYMRNHKVTRTLAATYAALGRLAVQPEEEQGTGTK